MCLILSHWSCHSKDPTTAVRPAKEPWFGAKIVIFLFEMLRLVLCGVVKSSHYMARSGNCLHDEETSDAKIQNFFIVSFRFIRVEWSKQCEDGI